MTLLWFILHRSDNTFCHLGTAASSRRILPRGISLLGRSRRCPSPRLRPIPARRSPGTTGMSRRGPPHPTKAEPRLKPPQPHGPAGGKRRAYLESSAAQSRADAAGLAGSNGGSGRSQKAGERLKGAGQRIHLRAPARPLLRPGGGPPAFLPSSLPPPSPPSPLCKTNTPQGSEQRELSALP